MLLRVELSLFFGDSYTEKSWWFIEPLIDDNTITFYARYVDDTFFVVNHEDVRCVQNLDPNLHFAVDLFQIEVPPS